MHDHAARARRGAPRFLIGAVAALCLAVPVLAAPGWSPEDPAEVAKRMEKALRTAHQLEALRHFQEDAAEYAELHDRLVGELGAPESVASQRTFAQALAKSRARARPGDVFQPDVEPVFRRMIAEQLEGPDALDARRALLEGNPADEPAAPVVVRVNGTYPVGASRSTVPPSVLLALPPLPACLHYRFVGRDLVLVDSVAGLIVDILPAAAPDLAARGRP